MGTLLEAIKKKVNGEVWYYRSLRTAIDHGWFTDGAVAIRLTEGERKEYKKKYGRLTAVKAAPLLDMNTVIPNHATFMLAVKEVIAATDSDPELIVLTTDKEDVKIQTSLYQMMLKHNPKGVFYLTSAPRTHGIQVALSEAGQVVGLVMEYGEKPRR